MTGTVCTPGEKMPCYDGTPGTAGIGPCKEGEQTCLPDGTGYGTCDGQFVDIAKENCATPADDNCNNLSNLQEGCCIASTPVTCYTGPAATKDVGQCKHGNTTCNADGTFPADCPGEKLPVEEFCAAVADEDCNGYNCWVWNVGKGGFGNEYASAVATDGGFQNRIYIGGAFNNDISFGPGGFSPVHGRVVRQRVRRAIQRRQLARLGEGLRQERHRGGRLLGLGGQPDGRRVRRVLRVRPHRLRGRPAPAQQATSTATWRASNTDRSCPGAAAASRAPATSRSIRSST